MVIYSREVIDLARFFLQPGQLLDDQVTITDEDAHHITKVLRLGVDDEIECVDQAGQVTLVRIREVGKRVLGTVIGVLDCSQESPLTLTLFQGLAKGDKMDLVIQKAVELGVQEVIPFFSRYTVVKLDEKQAKSKQTRWQRIALEAAKQSGRTRVPVVHEPCSFAGLMQRIAEGVDLGGLVLLAYEAEQHTGIRDVDARPQAVSVIVGPEGGFAREEVEALTQAGAKVCSLGPRILRTETAGLVLLSIVGYKWGDLG